MSARVTKLPSSSTTYITVRKSGRRWAVLMVTPGALKNITTTLYRVGDRDQAMELGQQVAEKIKRPFKGRAAA